MEEEKEEQKEEVKEESKEDRKIEKVNDMKKLIDQFLNQKRMKALNEIFTFYSKQHIGSGSKSTFDELGNIWSSLSLGEFMKFWNDFRLPIEKYIQK